MNTESETKKETEDVYRRKARAKLDEIQAEIDRLKAKAEQIDADARIQAARELNDLEIRKKQMQIRLDELKASGEAAFEEMKTGFEKAFTDLKSAVDKAVSKFE